MVDRPGLEPGSLSLRGWTSPSKFAIYMVGVLGIEPRLASSKPAVISHYTIPQYTVFNLSTEDRLFLRNTKFLKSIAVLPADR
jgi:hypothetical protein